MASKLLLGLCAILAGCIFLQIVSLCDAVVSIESHRGILMRTKTSASIIVGSTTHKTGVAPWTFTCRLRGGGRKRGSKLKEIVDSSSEEEEDEDMNDSEEESSDEESSDERMSHRKSESRHKQSKHRRSAHHKSSRASAKKDMDDDESESSEVSSEDYNDEEDMNSVSADFSEESAESAAAENEDPSMQSSEPDESDLENNLDSKKLLSLKDARAAENREFTGEKRELAEAPSGKLIHLPSSGHAEDVLLGLQRLRQNKSTCDVVIVGSDGTSEFHAHKAVISAVSPELGSLINEKQNRLVLAGVDEQSLRLLVDFIYSGHASVAEEHLPTVLGLSERLCIPGLRQSCAEHLLRQLSIENAIRFRNLGQVVKCTELYEAAHHLIMDEFHAVSQTPSFLELDAAVLKELISSDDLAIASEKDVFDAVIRWAEHDETNRKSELVHLLGFVRLGLLTLDTLAKRVAPCPLIQKYVAQDPSFQAMLNSAITYVGSQNDGKARLEGPQTRLRSGSRGRYMMVVGGRKGADAHALSNVWMLDRVHYDWYELEPMISPRKQLAAAELDGKLYVCGGWDGSQYLRGVEFYEPGPKSWRQASLMQVARGSFGLATMQGELWAAGGYDGNRHLASVERFNASAQVWSAAAPLITARSGLRLVHFANQSGHSLFAIGGFDGQSVLPNVERYDPVSQTWKQYAPMSFPRRDFAACVHDGLIYVAGGFDGKSDLSSVERYDPVRNQWTTVANMTVRRSGFGMCSLNGKLHAVGGYDGVTYLSSAEIYDHKLDTWMRSIEAALPARMAHFAVALV